ncbi:MAG: aquaporin, partial [Candidatus Nanopelagicaceae bacterium]
MQKAIAEFLGTFLLLNAIVGSGFMATQLTNDVALQLLINALSTILTLAVVIKLFQNISGAQFNPVVTLYDLLRKNIKFKQSMIYLLAQIFG